MDELTRPLIFLPNAPESLLFTSKSSRGPNTVYPERDRLTHGQWLQNRFEEIWQESTSRQEERVAASVPTRNGVYVEFSGQPGAPLKMQSLENIPSGIRLLNIREKEVEGQNVNMATVYIPSDKRGVFLKKFREYTLEDLPLTGKPKNQDLAVGIEHMQKALLDSFWVDPIVLMPSDAPLWCEVWLRSVQPDDDESLLAEFFAICSQLNIGFKNQHIRFPERLVTLIQANQQQLGELIESFDFIAEIRKAQEPETFWTSQYNAEQAEWVEDLLSRLEVTNSNVYVAILDTGINNGHSLLSPVLSTGDCHTVVPEWRIDDNKGHGTLMAGICTYGDLKSALESNNPIELISHLESVKILPNAGDSDANLYGLFTAQGIYLAEVKNPQANRIICLAVTSPVHTDQGRPSSWSAAIDALASGVGDDQKRLFIISAGNVRDHDDLINYPESNRDNSVESPAQSWNALTVGAYTRKSMVAGDEFNGYELLASPGSLSPFSTTSLSWETKIWPNKPDVIFEGGNLLITPDGEIEFNDDLNDLTTFHQPFRKQFSTIWGTSLATAKATNMAATIQFYYPNFWPETIRGLMVHSAEWPDELLRQFNLDRNKKTSDVAQILRIAGYGVPDLKKALQCASNSLTLIAQNTLQPFVKEKSDYKTNEMHLYRLPWPREELMNLGPVQVKLRITLSFFIEPGPGEIGWKNRYRYASHGLRFDLNNTDEREHDFIRRLNKAANTEVDELIGGTSGSERWQIGVNNRKQGSLHSDTWVGNAADLAVCNMIGIYPIIGWWRERHNQGCFNKQTRYTLIVSLEVPEQEVDIYTTVRNLVAIPVEIQV
jgi:hypothetical protein